MRKEQRELVELAERLDFTFVGFDGAGHIELKHSSGKHVTLAATPSEYRGRANAIALLERIAGRRLPRANHRRSRKSTKSSGFSLELARHESSKWHGDHDADLAELAERREALIERCRRLARSRNRLREIPPLLTHIASIEARMRALSQPVDAFDPFTLNGDDVA